MSHLTRRQFLTSAFASPPHHVTQPFVTPNADFFRPLLRRAPRLNPAYWGLSIGGRVRHPLGWSYDDLQAMPQVELPCTLACASNPPGGERIGHAVWGGVPVRALLDELMIDEGARFARLSGADGHVTGVAMNHLNAALVAFEMNGQPLTAEQGFPARLIVPGLYDYKMPRWIERIDLTDAPVTGDWEARGWAVDGMAAPTAGITSPRSFEPMAGVVRLEGYAFAGLYDVRAVELSIEGGDWTAIPFTPNAPFSWTRWTFDWTPSAPGDYEARVRAIGGNLQPGASPPARQTNISDAHSRIVRVSR